MATRYNTRQEASRTVLPAQGIRETMEVPLAWAATVVQSAPRAMQGGAGSSSGHGAEEMTVATGVLRGDEGHHGRDGGAQESKRLQPPWP